MISNHLFGVSRGYYSIIAKQNSMKHFKELSPPVIFPDRAIGPTPLKEKLSQIALVVNTFLTASMKSFQRNQCTVLPAWDARVMYSDEDELVLEVWPKFQVSHFTCEAKRKPPRHHRRHMLNMFSRHYFVMKIECHGCLEGRRYHVSSASITDAQTLWPRISLWRLTLSSISEHCSKGQSFHAVGAVQSPHASDSIHVSSDNCVSIPVKLPEINSLQF